MRPIEMTLSPAVNLIVNVVKAWRVAVGSEILKLHVDHQARRQKSTEQEPERSEKPPRRRLALEASSRVLSFRVALLNQQ